MDFNRNIITIKWHLTSIEGLIQRRVADLIIPFNKESYEANIELSFLQ